MFLQAAVVYITCKHVMVGWVGLDPKKWTHGQLCTGYIYAFINFLFSSKEMN